MGFNKINGTHTEEMTVLLVLLLAAFFAFIPAPVSVRIRFTV